MTVLITGASAGIGEAFAREFARLGFDLIITARREERLKNLAAELAAGQGVSVDVVSADLTNRADVQRLEDLIRNQDSLLTLINNAGFGVSGSYVEQSVERHQRMIDVHISATVRLTHAALPGMIQRGEGNIINVSSIAGFIQVQGGPGYSASKAYLNSFSTNLHSAVCRKGVKIQALCPGFTYTEFHNSSEYQGNEREELPGWVWMTAEEVVACSLRHLGSDKVIVIPGFKNRLIAIALKSAWGRWLMGLKGRLIKRR
jgi:short-subunit dehydrogenase